MSYKKQLNGFNKLKEKWAKGKTGEQLISWYISNEPFGLYFAAEELWQRKDQYSKDRAIGYYERFVKHTDIVEEGAEVKKAIKIVLKAYRTGYGDKKEQYSAAEAFERVLVSKNFKVPAGKKRPTESDNDRRNRRSGGLNIITGAVGVLGTAVTGVVMVAKIFKENTRK